jgi:hypothetical protein
MDKFKISFKVGDKKLSFNSAEELQNWQQTELAKWEFLRDNIPLLYNGRPAQNIFSNFLEPIFYRIRLFTESVPRLSKEQLEKELDGVKKFLESS